MKKCEYHQTIREGVIYYLPVHDKENDEIINGGTFVIYAPSDNHSMKYYMFAFVEGKPKLYYIDTLYEDIIPTEVYDILVMLYQMNINTIEVFEIQQESIEAHLLEYFLNYQ